jgi:hypothetical protein
MGRDANEWVRDAGRHTWCSEWTSRRRFRDCELAKLAKTHVVCGNKTLDALKRGDNLVDRFDPGIKTTLDDSGRRLALRLTRTMLSIGTAKFLCVSEEA